MALRVGLEVGLRVGLKSGVNGDTTSSWTIDASSSKALPQNDTEWDALIDDAGVSAVAPDSIYLCQEASGNLADVNSGFPLTLTGAGHTFQQAVTGWTAKAVGLTDGTTGSWSSTDAALPDIASASCLVLAYVALPAATPGNTRNLTILGTTIAAARFNITTGFQSALSAANVANGATNLVDRVMPIWLRVDRTASSVTVLSDLEVLVPTFGGTMTGRAFRLGSNGNAATARYLYAARWDGAAAEMSDATIKAISQSAGWVIPW